MRRAYALGMIALGSSSIAVAGCATAEGTGFGGGGGTGAFAGAGGSGNQGAVGGFSGSGGSGATTSGGGTAGDGGAPGGGGSAGGPSGGTGGGGSGGAPSGGGGSGGSGGTSSGGGSGGAPSGGGGSGGSGGAPSGGGGGSGGGGVKGDCCSETQMVPGCNQPSVESCVCAQDSFCCSSEWDSLCAGETLIFKCGTCPTPTDCCSAGKCSSVAVSECVGDTDSTCYSTWSAGCASQVTTLGCGTCGNPTTPSVWINEIHYDNASTDTGEGVEVAGTAGTNLSGYKLVFYNGNPNQLKQYKTTTISATIPSQQNGFGTVWVAVALIENGGPDGSPQPDGVALVDGASKVVQFLSYEGSFKPTDGPAAGMTSTDIGKSELSTQPAGQSLGLTGTGKKYSDFVWSGPITASPGQPNPGQTFN